MVAWPWLDSPLSTEQLQVLSGFSASCSGPSSSPSAAGFAHKRRGTFLNSFFVRPFFGLAAYLGFTAFHECALVCSAAKVRSEPFEQVLDLLLPTG